MEKKLKETIEGLKHAYDNMPFNLPVPKLSEKYNELWRKYQEQKALKPKDKD